MLCIGSEAPAFPNCGWIQLLCTKPGKKDGKIIISNVARTVAGTVQEHFFFLWPLREGMSVHWYDEGHLI